MQQKLSDERLKLRLNSPTIGFILGTLIRRLRKVQAWEGKGYKSAGWAKSYLLQMSSRGNRSRKDNKDSTCVTLAEELFDPDLVPLPSTHIKSTSTQFNSQEVQQ